MRTGDSVTSMRNSLFGARPSHQSIVESLDSLKPGESFIVVIAGPIGAGKTEFISHTLRQLCGWESALVSSLPWQSDLAGGIASNFISRFKTQSLSETCDVEQASTVFVIDDAHWADPESLKEIIGLARQVTLGRVAILMALDSNEPGHPKFPVSQIRQLADVTLDLPPLNVEEIQEFAMEHIGARISPVTAVSIHSITGGRPAYIRQLLDEASSEHWRQQHPLIKIPESWQDRLRQKTGGCNLTEVLQAAALIHSDPFAIDVDLVEHLLDDKPEQLDEAFRLGLLSFSPRKGEQSIHFRDPIDRAVIRSQISPSNDRKLHARAANFYRSRSNLDAATFHEALSIKGSDDDHSLALGRRAQSQGLSGAWRAAAETYQLASQVASSTSLALRQNLSSIEAFIAASDIPLARMHSSALINAPSDASVNATRGYLAAHEGRRLEATTMIESAWNYLEEGEIRDPNLRARVASRQTLLALNDWQPARLLEWANITKQWAPPNTPANYEAQYIALIGRAAVSGKLPVDEPLPGETTTMSLRREMAHGWLSIVHDDPVAAHQRLRHAAHGEGSERIAVWMEAWDARAHLLLGDLDQAAHVAERGLARAEQFGIHFLEPLLLWTASTVATFQGNRDLARTYLNRVTLSNDAFAIQRIPSAMSHIVAGSLTNDISRTLRYGRKLDALQSQNDFGHPGFWPWEDVYAQALILDGKYAEAEDVTSRAEDRAKTSSIESIKSKLKVPRASLLIISGNQEKGIKLFSEAVEQIESRSLPFYQSRVLYEYGRILRRLGRRRAADEAFARAGEVFAAMEARDFVEKCNRERRAGGLGTRVSGAGGLTPQEEEIAKAVADGASNRDVAQEMFLSTKTVEYHLTRVYRKLNIRNRNELAKALYKFLD